MLLLTIYHTFQMLISCPFSFWPKESSIHVIWYWNGGRGYYGILQLSTEIFRARLLLSTIVPKGLSARKDYCAAIKRETNKIQWAHEAQRGWGSWDDKATWVYRLRVNRRDIWEVNGVATVWANSLQWFFTHVQRGGVVGSPKLPGLLLFCPSRCSTSWTISRR